MAELNTALSLQPWRVRALFVGPGGTHATLTGWTLLREGIVQHRIAQVWAVDTTATIELALEAPLLPGVPYTLAHTSSTRVVTFAYAAAPRETHPEETDEQGDPEGEAFGEDVDWLAEGLTAARDLPAVRGLPALKHDLAALAVLNPGELVHRPAAGIGLRSRVNGCDTEASLRELEADVTAAFLADDRVREVATVIEQDPDRALTRLKVSVLTPQLPGETVDFAARI